MDSTRAEPERPSGSAADAREMEAPVSWGQLLRHYRQRARLTQEELAERSGYSTDYVSKLERDQRQPPAVAIERLATVLDLPPHERATLLAVREHVRIEPPPPLRVTPPLPVAVTSFIGRSTEIQAVAALLRRDDVRLLTLTGPGGIGNTRLALRVAGELADAFAEGLVFVPLAALVDPDDVAATVGATLGLKEVPGVPIAQTIALHLHARHMLLILDNFEHVRPAALFVAALVAQCPHVHILVTSRAPLQLAAEQRYDVPPLPTPAPEHLDGPDLDAELLARHDAMALFVARAQAVHPQFTLTPRTAPAAGALCRSLDGLPLAIELAAARTRLFPPPELLRRLSGQFALLAGGSQDRAPRHQTLRAAIDWSYALLSPHEQQLFTQLSVFAGGATFDAIAAICDPDGTANLLEAVSALVDNSLVRQEGEQDARFVLLATIRAYAAEKVAERGEGEAVGQRHAAFFLALAQEIEPELTGPQQSEGLTRLESELDNLRGALGWLWDQGRVADELRLASALYWLWLVRGHCREARHWLDEGLDRGQDVAPGVRAAALWALGGIAVEQGDNARATAVLEAALALFRTLGDAGGSARTLNLLGVAAWRRGAYERALAHYEEGLRLATALGDRREQAVALVNLGVIATHQGDFTLARERLEEGLALYRAQGDRHGTMHALINLGYDATLRGQLGEAEAMFAEVLATAQESGMTRHVAYALENLGNIATLQGEHTRAASRLQEGLHLARELGDQHLILYLLSDLTKLEVARGRPASAARLDGSLVGLRGQLGIAMPPAEDQDREQSLERARQELGVTGFERAWVEGHTLSLDAAVSYAMQETGRLASSDREERTGGSLDA